MSTQVKTSPYRAWLRLLYLKRIALSALVSVILSVLISALPSALLSAFLGALLDVVFTCSLKVPSKEFSKEHLQLLSVLAKVQFNIKCSLKLFLSSLKLFKDF